MDRPKGISNLSPEIQGYIDYLESEVKKIKSSGDADVYMAISHQMRQISEQVRGIHLDIQSDKDDKTFDRFIKFSEKAASISNDLKKIRENLLPEDKQKIRQDALVEKHIFEE